MEASSEAEPVEPNAVGTLESAPLDRQTIGAALDRMGLRRPGERLRVPAAGRRRVVGNLAGRIAGPPAVPEAGIAAPRVAQLWEAPVVRNHYEAAWFRVAGGICPDAVPRLLGEDEPHGMFAMDYLDPAAYPVWKNLLRDGHADPAVAAAVGARLARSTPRRPAMPRSRATSRPTTAFTRCASSRI